MYSHIAELLKAEDTPIYAVMDGARDRCVPGLLRKSGFQYRSLFDGKAAEELGSFGPFLVELTDNIVPLGEWIDKIWGRSFGIFVACTQPFDVLRGHFRHFTFVELEIGRKAYFRFYDPRVLRVFLPNCTYEEWIQFFGPVQSYFAESDDGKCLLRFYRDADEPEPDRLIVTGA